ncbi:lipase 3-like [Planococcus citri]|uniref:lipase 3-like n=1 Tax=Planococcus citri TaxID=170843 RepID=UPI0031F7A0D2
MLYVLEVSDAREMNVCLGLVIFLWNFLFSHAQLLRRPFQREVHKELPPKVLNNTADYIEHYGYTAEHHNVISEDGFLISVFRIPSEGTPILLQHGLLLASDSWVLQGPEYDLAFILADKGYDVWIADNRGNTYSRAHLKLSPKSAKFWNFSFHEMGYYDMPAVINYILHLTKHKAVDIIGHSIGATNALIMCSTRPEYNEKVRSVIALAPGVFFNSSSQSNVQQILARYGPYLKFLHVHHGVNEFFPRNDLSNRASRIMCRIDSPLYHLCLFYMQNVLGFTSITKQHHKPAIDYSNATPRGVSYKTLLHVTQFGQLGKFMQFDYGPKTNIMVYGTRTPPEYNLSQVTAPVALLYSDGDVHIASQDVSLLQTQLPNVVASYRIDKHLFNHMDFIWGGDARETVYDFILEIFNHLDNENIDSET